MFPTLVLFAAMLADPDASALRRHAHEGTAPLYTLDRRQRIESLRLFETPAHPHDLFEIVEPLGLDTRRELKASASLPTPGGPDRTRREQLLAQLEMLQNLADRQADTFRIRASVYPMRTFSCNSTGVVEETVVEWSVRFYPSPEPVELPF